MPDNPFTYQDENSIFWEAVKNLESEVTPVYGLENKTPYNDALRRNMNNPNYGFRYSTPDPVTGYTYPIAIQEGYWDKWQKYRGQQVLPMGYPAKDQVLPSQEWTDRLIDPRTNPATPYYRGNLPAEPLYVNGMADYRTTVSNPKITRTAVRYIPTTPEEKAAYLRSQAERGFTLVGQPYTPQSATGIDGYISTNGTLVNRPSATGIDGYISTDGKYFTRSLNDTRLAPTTMLSKERVPFNDAYRAGQSTTGTPYMSAGRAIKYMPQFLAQPEVARELMRLAGRAGQGLGVAGILTDAYNRATSDYENPVTGETYSKKDVTNLDGLNYANADLQTIAMFHPDNADQHPEITDAMRDKFFKKKK